MRSEWPWRPLGELIVSFDTWRKPVKEAHRVKGPYPYYGASGIVDHVEGYLFDGEYLLIAEDGENLRTRNTPVAFRATGRFWVNNHAHIVQGNSAASTRFLEHAVLAADIAPYLTGAVMPKLTQANLSKILVRCPPRAAQDLIVEVLGALDDRIELLRQTNATLEAIAQALFKSWFIDFDPVRAKAEGREPEGMDAQTAALFPDGFEESDLGAIPRGWKVGPIADWCSRVSNGGTPSRSNPDFWTGGTVPWFKSGELFDTQLHHPIERINSSAISSTSVKVFPRHAVLMAIYAAPTVGRLGVLTGEAAFNQACTGMVAKPEIGPWFLFQTLLHGRDWFNSRANGAAQQNISKGIVEAYRSVRPTLQLLRTFNEFAAGLYAAAERNAEQAYLLVDLRDTLLPRLISGKLRIPQALEQAAEALS